MEPMGQNQIQHYVSCSSPDGAAGAKYDIPIALLTLQFSFFDLLVYI